MFVIELSIAGLTEAPEAQADLIGSVMAKLLFALFPQAGCWIDVKESYARPLPTRRR